MDRYEDGSPIWDETPEDLPYEGPTQEDYDHQEMWFWLAKVEGWC